MIIFWFDRNQLPSEHEDSFVAIIRQLDEAYIKWADENKPKGKGKKGMSENRPPRPPRKKNMPKKDR